MPAPLISVVMPVYNGKRFLTDSIGSILNQTWKDFEFIIIDDGSTDGSVDVIRSFGDRRIILLQNETNIGNYPSRNRGMKMARGKYIAVMDADDFALPGRLMRQFLYMEDRPETAITGSLVVFSTKKVLLRPVKHEEIKVGLLECNSVPHSTLFLRKTDVVKHNLYYDETYRYSADYELLTRAIDCVKINVVPEVLLMYRLHSEQISSANSTEQLRLADRVRVNYLSRLGILTSPLENSIHRALVKGDCSATMEECQAWGEKVVRANRDVHFFDEPVLKRFLAFKLNAYQTAIVKRKISNT